MLGWKVLGHEQRLDAHIVNYADDFVICCRGTAEQAMAAMREIMVEAETDGERGQDATVPAAGRTVDFLGYTIGRCYSPKTGVPTLGTRPSKKKVQRLCREISEMTGRRWTLKSAEERVKAINRKLLGWAQLLLSRPSEQSLSRRGPTRRETAPPMDVRKASGTRPGDRTLPQRVSATNT